MKIHFLLNERVHAEPNPVFAGAMSTLRERGFQVSGGIAEEAVVSPDTLRPRHDLYVLKSQTELSLGLAAVLHDHGARLLNPYPACALLQNKITAAGRLAASHVPVPRSWAASDPGLLRELATVQPLVVKPYRGHRGAGVVVIRSPAELDALPCAGQPMLVQQFIAGARGDLKVYVVGERVFAVRKPFSSGSFRGAGTPCPVTPQVRDIALRCGRAFGLGLYGLDIVEGAHGPVVVDLNYSPGFRGVPGAAPLIARYVEDFAAGRAPLPAAPPPLPAAPAEARFPQGADA